MTWIRTTGATSRALRTDPAIVDGIPEHSVADCGEADRSFRTDGDHHSGVPIIVGAKRRWAVPGLTLHPIYANIGMYQRMKNLTWLADSRSNVKSFPAGVQDDVGYALYAAQLGERSVKAKPLHGLGGQMMEIVAWDASGNLPRDLYGLDWRIDLRAPRLPEEVQGRDRDTEAGDGADPAAAQTVEK